MATPFQRTLNSIRSEQDDLAIQLFMYLCVILVMALGIYGLFFTDTPVSTEQYSLLPSTHYSDTRTSGRPVATRKVTALFPADTDRQFKTGAAACLEISDPSTSNSRQVCGTVTGVSGDSKGRQIQIDLPLEHERSLDIPNNNKARILIYLPGESIFDSAMDRLGIKKSYRSISFTPAGGSPAK